MNSHSKPPQFNPAVLPMEFRPRMAYVSDENHTKHYLIPGKIFASAQPFAIHRDSSSLQVADPQSVGISDA